MTMLTPFEAYWRAAGHAQHARDKVADLPPSVPMPEPGATRAERAAYVARGEAVDESMLHAMLASTYAQLANAGATGLQSTDSHLRGRWQNTVLNPDED